MPAFRLSLVADVVMMLADIGLALVFFALLAPVQAGLARAAMIFRLMQAGLIDVAPLLTHTFPLAEFAEAFENGLYKQDRGFMRQIGQQILDPKQSPFEPLDHPQVAHLGPAVGVPVQPVQQVQIHVVHLQALELLVEQAVAVPQGVDQPAGELCGQLDHIPIRAPERLADDALAVAAVVRTSDPARHCGACAPRPGPAETEVKGQRCGMRATGRRTGRRVVSR